MATKKVAKKKVVGRVTEIYVRISVGSGKKKDTIAHGAESVSEAVAFINKHAK